MNEQRLKNIPRNMQDVDDKAVVYQPLGLIGIKALRSVGLSCRPLLDPHPHGAELLPCAIAQSGAQSSDEGGSAPPPHLIKTKMCKFFRQAEPRLGRKCLATGQF